MTTKTSFILHMDSLGVLEHLDDKQAGKLLKAMYSYHLGDEMELDAATTIAFHHFKSQFARDGKKYLATCERNRTNGAKGGRPKKEATPTENPNNPGGLSETQKTQMVFPETQENPSEPKKPDKDKDKDKDKDTDTDTDTDTDNDRFRENGFCFETALMNQNVDKAVVSDFMIVRANKKATNTKTAYDGLLREIKKSGRTIPDGIRLCTEKGWAKFEADWEANDTQSQNKSTKDLSTGDLVSDRSWAQNENANENQIPNR